MKGKACPRVKSNRFSSESARGSTRWCYYAGGYRDCTGARFSWRCVAKLERAPRSRCAFPCESGSELALATQLAMLPQPPRLVFTTGNANRATDAFRLEAVDYLLKPLDPEQVAEAVNRLLALSAAL